MSKKPFRMKNNKNFYYIKELQWTNKAAKMNSIYQKLNSQNTTTKLESLTLQKEKLWNDRFVYSKIPKYDAAKDKNVLDPNLLKIPTMNCYYNVIKSSKSNNNILSSKKNIREKNPISYHKSTEKTYLNCSAKNVLNSKFLSQNSSSKDIFTTNNINSRIFSPQINDNNKNSQNNADKLIKLWNDLCIQEPYRELFNIILSQLNEQRKNDISQKEYNELSELRNNIQVLSLNVYYRLKTLEDLNNLNDKLGLTLKSKQTTSNEIILKNISKKIENLREYTVNLCLAMKAIKEKINAGHPWGKFDIDKIAEKYKFDKNYLIKMKDEMCVLKEGYAKYFFNIGDDQTPFLLNSSESTNNNRKEDIFMHIVPLNNKLKENINQCIYIIYQELIGYQNSNVSQNNFRNISPLKKYKYNDKDIKTFKMQKENMNSNKSTMSNNIWLQNKEISPARTFNPEQIESGYLNDDNKRIFSGSDIGSNNAYSNYFNMNSVYNFNSNNGNNYQNNKNDDENNIEENNNDDYNFEQTNNFNDKNENEIIKDKNEEENNNKKITDKKDINEQDNINNKNNDKKYEKKNYIENTKEYNKDIEIENIQKNNNLINDNNENKNIQNENIIYNNNNNTLNGMNNNINNQNNNYIKDNKNMANEIKVDNNNDINNNDKNEKESQINGNNYSNESHKNNKEEKKDIENIGKKEQIQKTNNFTINAINNISKNSKKNNNIISSFLKSKNLKVKLFKDNINIFSKDIYDCYYQIIPYQIKDMFKIQNNIIPNLFKGISPYLIYIHDDLPSGQNNWINLRNNIFGICTINYEYKNNKLKIIINHLSTSIEFNEEKNKYYLNDIKHIFDLLLKYIKNEFYFDEIIIEYDNSKSNEDVLNILINDLNFSLINEIDNEDDEEENIENNKIKEEDENKLVYINDSTKNKINEMVRQSAQSYFGNNIFNIFNSLLITNNYTSTLQSNTNRSYYQNNKLINQTFSDTKSKTYSNYDDNVINVVSMNYLLEVKEEPKIKMLYNKLTKLDQLIKVFNKNKIKNSEIPLTIAQNIFDILSCVINKTLINNCFSNKTIFNNYNINDSSSFVDINTGVFYNFLKPEKIVVAHNEKYRMNFYHIINKNISLFFSNINDDLLNFITKNNIYIQINEIYKEAITLNKIDILNNKLIWIPCFEIYNHFKCLSNNAVGTIHEYVKISNMPIRQTNKESFKLKKNNYLSNKRNENLQMKIEPDTNRDIFFNNDFIFGIINNADTLTNNKNINNNIEKEENNNDESISYDNNYEDSNLPYITFLSFINKNNFISNDN